LAIPTVEEARVETLVKHLADQLNLPLFVWTHSTGLRRLGEHASTYNTIAIAPALAHVRSSSMDALYLLQGIADELEQPQVRSLLRELAEQFSTRKGAVILTSETLDIPENLKGHTGYFKLPPPRPDEFRALLVRLLRDIRQRVEIKIEITNSDLNKLIRNLQGLTLLEAEKVLTKAIIEDETLSAADIRSVIEAKRKIVEQEGLLEYYPVEETMTDIAGLHRVKDWLRKRRQTILDPEKARRYGLPFPKGLLLLGVPGTGKSLTAKAVAMEWSLPLLKMDPASLYNKYMGETERNFRRAMEVAEKMSPVVLWIDEIEKAFASAGDSDGGASIRVLGTFLSWLQERQGDVFVVATANDVSRLPPELLRKGRFDEIFFVDLPTLEVRVELFRGHLKRRDQRLPDEALLRAAQAADEFSGAEIEQVIVAALHTSFSESQKLTTEVLLGEIAQTRPLAVTMAERIHDLREWASSRATPAG
jgi:SpoVK/Ycf46/Vps4 family AAA+-type ATPase